MGQHGCIHVREKPGGQPGVLSYDGVAASIETFASVNPWAMLVMDTVGAGEASLGVLGDRNSPQLYFLSLSFPGS